MSWPIQWIREASEPFADAQRIDPARRGEFLCLPQALVVQDYVTAKGVRHGLRLLVDGYSATLRVVRGTLAFDEHADAVPEFEYPLDESTTVELANRLLSKLLLGRLIARQTRRLGNPRIDAIVQYPYHAVYLQDRHGRIRYDLTDRITGKRVGSDIRQGLLQAFARHGQSVACARAS